MIEREGLHYLCFNEKRLDEYRQAQVRYPDADRFLRLYHNDSSSARNPNAWPLEGVYRVAGGEQAESRCRCCLKPGQWAYGFCDDCRRRLIKAS